MNIKHAHWLVICRNLLRFSDEQLLKGRHFLMMILFFSNARIFKGPLRCYLSWQQRRDWRRTGAYQFDILMPLKHPQVV